MPLSGGRQIDADRRGGGGDARPAVAAVCAAKLPAKRPHSRAAYTVAGVDRKLWVGVGAPAATAAALRPRDYRRGVVNLNRRLLLGNIAGRVDGACDNAVSAVA